MEWMVLMERRETQDFPEPLDVPELKVSLVEESPDGMVSPACPEKTDSPE